MLCNLLQEFLQDVFPSELSRSEKRKSDENVSAALAKKHREEEEEEDDSELLSLADCTEAQFTSQVSENRLNSSACRTVVNSQVSDNRLNSSACRTEVNSPAYRSPLDSPDCKRNNKSARNTQRKFPGPAGLLPQLVSYLSCPG